MQKAPPCIPPRKPLKKDCTRRTERRNSIAGCQYNRQACTPAGSHNPRRVAAVVCGKRSPAMFAQAKGPLV